MASYNTFWLTTAFSMFMTQANAACPSGFDPFTICDINSRGAVVAVCHDNTTVTYSYRTVGENPELTLSETINNIDYFPWDVPGPLSGSVTFHNGTYAYEVVSVFKADPFDGAASGVNHFGWVTVTQNGETVDRLECRPEPVRYAYGSGIYEAKEAAGLFWDGYEKGWVSLPD